ncbi:MAG: hypothetical protein JSS81_12385 [Acidobacteria bacterium]|nr:hypothetical protein [Acidobacteriota bacterium]
MSKGTDQQSVPIIIKGGSKRGIIATAIEIQANSVFQVTESFQQQQSDWIQSDSEFSISYVESVAIGDMGPEMQFCQTSAMAHPLTYEFKDDQGSNIFTIREMAGNDGYYLQISVDSKDDYFQITKDSGNEAWTVSLFDTTAAEIYAVEVTDANSVPVCRMLRANEEDIFLNLEPAV